MITRDHLDPVARRRPHVGTVKVMGDLNGDAVTVTKIETTS